MTRLLHLLQNLSRELPRVLFGQRLDGQSGVAGKAASPSRPPLEQFRASRREQQQRNVTDTRSQHFQQVEHAVVGPVDVLEDEHRRPLRRKRLDHTARRVEKGLAVTDTALASQTDQQRDVRSDLVGVAVDQFCNRGVELFGSAADLVRVEDPRHLLDLRSESPVREHLAVGKRSSRNHTRALSGGKPPELGGETGLADSRRAEERY